jgi:predicted DNA-binding protein YlxM (UPF0122 family)
MDANLRTTLLLDFYGQLLTARQREALSLHVEEDLSYGEIAAELGVSRQAAADAAGTAREALDHYESKLGLVEKHIHTRDLLEKAVELADALDGAQALRAILAELQGEDEHGV